MKKKNKKKQLRSFFVEKNRHVYGGQPCLVRRRLRPGPPRPAAPGGPPALPAPPRSPPWRARYCCAFGACCGGGLLAGRAAADDDDLPITATAATPGGAAVAIYVVLILCIFCLRVAQALLKLSLHGYTGHSGGQHSIIGW